MNDNRTRAIVLSLAVLFTSSCGKPQGAQSVSPSQSLSQLETNPAELERDYPQGFFESDTDTTEADYNGGETHRDGLGRGELTLPYQITPLFQFEQTTWDECNEGITGNYTGFSCSNGRGISVILKSFVNDFIYQCIDKGLAAQGGGASDGLHVIHAGIIGDLQHSPKSLHAEQRAIDIKVLRVLLQNGKTKQFTYSKLGNRPFYTALRKCWGRVVSQFNECPLYSGEELLTGSIGWENSAHGKHMHLSVPYCFNNQHGPFFWRR